MLMIRIKAPAKAVKGEVIELKAMIQHKMETGYRRDRYGRQIPKDILRQFECTYNDEVVFRAEFFPAVAANPILVFHTVAKESGSLVFKWIDEAGVEVFDKVELEVV
jgi:sulfur-oxidizing protein SoxZ